MEEDPGKHGLNTCLPALPVGTAAAAFPDILISSAAELKMKKRVLLRTKRQMLQVCGGGLVQSLHQMMHLTMVWLNLMGVSPQV